MVRLQPLRVVKFVEKEYHSGIFFNSDIEKIFVCFHSLIDMLCKESNNCSKVFG